MGSLILGDILLVHGFCFPVLFPIGLINWPAYHVPVGLQ